MVSCVVFCCDNFTLLACSDSINRSLHVIIAAPCSIVFVVCYPVLCCVVRTLLHSVAMRFSVLFCPLCFMLQTVCCVCCSVVFCSFDSWILFCALFLMHGLGSVCYCYCMLLH